MLSQQYVFITAATSILIVKIVSDTVLPKSKYNLKKRALILFPLGFAIELILILTVMMFLA